MKNLISVALLCFFSLAVAASQDETPQTEKKDPASVLRDYTRAGNMEGVRLSFVLLNDKTVDLLFSAPGKYSIRAQANQSTIFYVQGVSEKDITLNNKFMIEQDGQQIDCASINIENFAGGNVAKGKTIKGMLQLDRKLNLSRPFFIRSSQSQLEFKLSDSAVKDL